MTVRQLLHDYIDTLSEEAVAETAAFLLPVEGRLSDRDRRLVEQALAEADAGELIPLEEVEREFESR